MDGARTRGSKQVIKAGVSVSISGDDRRTHLKQARIDSREDDSLCNKQSNSVYSDKLYLLSTEGVTGFMDVLCAAHVDIIVTASKIVFECRSLTPRM